MDKEETLEEQTCPNTFFWLSDWWKVSHSNGNLTDWAWCHLCPARPGLLSSLLPQRLAGLQTQDTPQILIR